MRRIYVKAWAAIIGATVVLGWFFPPTLFLWVLLGPLFLLGLYDYFHPRKAILRNFPIAGHFRYIFEMIRPEIRQYFIESDRDGVPFNRERRSLVYQRAKLQLDTIPFGTKLDTYQEGYEWVNHSLTPHHLDAESLVTTIGGPDCKKPYKASILNISAMSYGSLAANAVTALNKGAAKGGFAHNTGEGGISSFHRQGGDLIWQIGTGYFGCRSKDGGFDRGLFKEKASLPEVKMIEVKLSQGAKPGHGGILPAGKVTPEIAAIRGVPMGQDVLSPPAHKTFDTPIGLMEWIQELREASGGKPIGFKLCVGKRREFISLCKAMIETGISPDFIAVDGGEGGTGAAPLEFSNHIGSPLKDSLIFVYNCLVGFNLKPKIKIMAGGKITSGFEIVSYLALGADLCTAARSFMLALGCIQALKCNSNECPVGVATQNTELTGGLVVKDKIDRVANYHKETIISAAEIMGAMGLTSHEDLRPWHLVRRLDHQTIHHYGELMEFLKPGDLLKDPLPASFARAISAASPKHFQSNLAQEIAPAEGM